jgi:uncharacterized delta-60 repeat protein
LKTTVNLFLLLLLLVTISEYGTAQIQREWVQRYNGDANSFDIASGMVTVPDGGILVYGSSIGTGTLTDFSIMRYSAEGNQLWAARYNGKANLSDQINEAIVSNDGSVYVSGFITANDNNTKFSAAKFSQNGNLLWLRVIEESGYNSGYGEAVLVGSTGKIVCAGVLRNSSDEYKTTLVSYSQDGVLERKVILNSFGNCFPISIQAGSSGSIFLAYEKSVENNGSDIAIVKFDSSLSLIWERTFSGNATSSADRPSDMKLDRSGNILISGSVLNASSSADYFVAKISSDGNVLWQNQYGGIFSDIPSSIATDISDNCYVTGYSRNGMGLGAEDILTLKISAGGALVWTSLFNGSTNGSDGGNSVAVDTNGNVYVGGYSDRGSVQVTYFILKLDVSGHMIWSDRYSVTAEPEDFIYSIVMDEESSVYVTGISLGDSTDYDITTIKYSDIIGIESNITALPSSAELHQNYPNPFNPNTKIAYDLRSRGNVSLAINEISGKQIAKLVNEYQSPGRYEVGFDAGSLPSGIYFYSLRVNGIAVSTRKMSLIK